MIHISHRGNINGKIVERENSPDYIEEAVTAGYFCEVDVWYDNSHLWLGHDEPQYKTSIDFIKSLSTKLIFHAKNHKAIKPLSDAELHWFWHDNDDYTLTSMGWVWAYPGMESPCENSIAVLPEIHNTNTENFWGICSDYIERYK